MARTRRLSLLLLLLLTLFTIKITTTSPPQPHLHRKNLDDIIDVLITSGDFSEWASLLSSADPSEIHLSATFFIPDDPASAVAGDSRNSILNPFVFAYHIVPRRLSFSDLLLLDPHARLPTLLHDKSILVTNTSAAGFSLDNAPLTVPDLFSSPSVAVHAVAAVLNYRIYGDTPNTASLPTPSRPRGSAGKKPPVKAGAPSRPRGPHFVWFLAACAMLFVF